MHSQAPISPCSYDSPSPLSCNSSPACAGNKKTGSVFAILGNYFCPDFGPFKNEVI